MPGIGRGGIRIVETLGVHDGTQIVRTFVVSMPFACPCLLCPYSYLSLRIVVAVLPVVPVLSMGRSTSMFPRVPAAHIGGSTLVHIGERHRRQDGSMGGRDTDTQGGETAWESETYDIRAA